MKQNPFDSGMSVQGVGKNNVRTVRPEILDTKFTTSAEKKIFSGTDYVNSSVRCNNYSQSGCNNNGIFKRVSLYKCEYFSNDDEY